MERQEFLSVSGRALQHIERVLGDIDHDGFDVELAGDVLTLSFGDGSKFVINAHSAARQVWMAAGSTAWHFDHDAASDTWIARKNGDELMVTLAAQTSKKLDVPVTL